jgi:hypothetical protein
VLRIVADEVRRYGACTAYMDALAARAGVCRSTAQNALRAARAHRLVLVEERRRRGQASLTNIVRIISPEWRAWLRLGGFKKFGTTDNRESEGSERGLKTGSRGVAGGVAWRTGDG